MSSFVEGQTHQFCDSLETAGCKPYHVTRMGQSQPLLKDILQVVDGKARIVTCENQMTRSFQRGVPLSATTGEEITEGVFGKCDDILTKVAPEPTDPCLVDIEDTIKHGKYRDIFLGFGYPFDGLYLTRGQMIRFCVDYKNLRGRGNGITLFLTKDPTGEPVVVRTQLVPSYSLKNPQAGPSLHAFAIPLFLDRSQWGCDKDDFRFRVVLRRRNQ